MRHFFDGEEGAVHWINNRSSWIKLECGNVRRSWRCVEIFESDADVLCNLLGILLKDSGNDSDVGDASEAAPRASTNLTKST